MASRCLHPLRAASRHIGFQSPASQFRSRTLVTASRAKQAVASTGTAKATPSTSAPAASKPAVASPSKPSTSATPKSPARAPTPQTTGDPLPSVALEAETDSGVPINWSSSFHGLGTSSFPPEVSQVLLAPIAPDDIEVKPDGIIYLPEIKYRRVLNAAFGPGGWGLAPRGELEVQERMVTREYALVVHGRFVAQARGEQQYFSQDGIPTASEGCKSNALMRCCKDLGIASELWDPRFIRKFMKQYAQQIWAEHITTKKKKQIWLRKDDEIRYPFKKAV